MGYLEIVKVDCLTLVQVRELSTSKIVRDFQVSNTIFSRGFRVFFLASFRRPDTFTSTSIVMIDLMPVGVHFIIII